MLYRLLRAVITRSQRFFLLIQRTFRLAITYPFTATAAVVAMGPRKKNTTPSKGRPVPKEARVASGVIIPRLTASDNFDTDWGEAGRSMLKASTRGFQCFVLKFSPAIIDYYRSEKADFDIQRENAELVGNELRSLAMVRSVWNTLGESDRNSWENSPQSRSKFPKAPTTGGERFDLMLEAAIYKALNSRSEWFIEKRKRAGQFADFLRANAATFIPSVPRVLVVDYLLRPDRPGISPHALELFKLLVHVDYFLETSLAANQGRVLAFLKYCIHYKPPKVVSGAAAAASKGAATTSAEGEGIAAAGVADGSKKQRKKEAKANAHWLAELGKILPGLVESGQLESWILPAIKDQSSGVRYEAQDLSVYPLNALDTFLRQMNGVEFSMGQSSRVRKSLLELGLVDALLEALSFFAEQKHRCEPLRDPQCMGSVIHKISFTARTAESNTQLLRGRNRGGLSGAKLTSAAAAALDSFDGGGGLGDEEYYFGTDTDEESVDTDWEADFVEQFTNYDYYDDDNLMDDEYYEDDDYDDFDGDFGGDDLGEFGADFAGTQSQYYDNLTSLALSPSHQLPPAAAASSSSLTQLDPFPVVFHQTTQFPGNQLQSSSSSASASAHKVNPPPGKGPKVHKSPIKLPAASKSSAPHGSSAKSGKGETGMTHKKPQTAMKTASTIKPHASGSQLKPTATVSSISPSTGIKTRSQSATAAAAAAVTATTAVKQGHKSESISGPSSSHSKGPTIYTPYQPPAAGQIKQPAPKGILKHSPQQVTMSSKMLQLVSDGYFPAKESSTMVAHEFINSLFMQTSKLAGFTQSLEDMEQKLDNMEQIVKQPLPIKLTSGGHLASSSSASSSKKWTKQGALKKPAWLAPYKSPYKAGSSKDKGVGYGDGSTQSQWNIATYQAKKTWSMQNVTTIINVLKAFIQPLKDEALTEEMQLALEPDFVLLLYRSCLAETLNTYLTNDSFIDITNNTRIYESVLSLLIALANAKPTPIEEAMLARARYHGALAKSGVADEKQSALEIKEDGKEPEADGLSTFLFNQVKSLAGSIVGNSRGGKESEMRGDSPEPGTSSSKGSSVLILNDDPTEQANDADDASRMDLTEGGRVDETKHHSDPSTTMVLEKGEEGAPSNSSNPAEVGCPVVEQTSKRDVDVFHLLFLEDAVPTQLLKPQQPHQQLHHPMLENVQRLDVQISDYLKKISTTLMQVEHMGEGNLTDQDVEAIIESTEEKASLEKLSELSRIACAIIDEKITNFKPLAIAPCSMETPQDGGANVAPVAAEHAPEPRESPQMKRKKLDSRAAVSSSLRKSSSSAASNSNRRASSNNNNNKEGAGESSKEQAPNNGMEKEIEYCRSMKPLQFASISFMEPNGQWRIPYHYQRSLSPAGVFGKHMRKIAKEIVAFNNSSLLPLSSSSSAFIRSCEERIDALKFMITGPSGTPYQNGCFEFDVLFPADYPQSPMQVNLETTGNHSVRFNPNLYNCGKVCLSILNTWSGRPEERWNPATSSLYQVIISLQSLVLVPDPYFNEPGFAKSASTPQGQKESQSYNVVIKAATVRWAMLEMLQRPPAGFADVVHEHFLHKRDEIKQQVEQWIREVDDVVKEKASGSGNLGGFTPRDTMVAQAAALKKSFESLKVELDKLRPKKADGDAHQGCSIMS